MGLFLANGEPASIGNVIWYDADKNGIQDSGEAGVVGVEVLLLDGAGNVIATTITGPDGRYQFANILPGDYRVQFAPPPGYAASPQNAGSDDALDSDIDPQTLTSPLITLGSGQSDLNLHAGFFLNEEPASIGDFVWFDYNLDGVQDATETGIPGVEVTLYRVDGDGNESEVGSVQTDIDGSYNFENLSSGDYFLSFAPPLGFISSPNNRAAMTPLTRMLIQSRCVHRYHAHGWRRGLNLGCWI